ncbi:MAG: hypothetical protein K8I02_09885, partial [Candidatus Methylomirabilis sp.]|nr:hypothetical protein [Deltaproteobacteria bacterium]
MSGRLSSTFEAFAERAGEQVSKALRWFFGLFTRLVSKAPFSRQTPLIALGMFVGLVAGVVSALFNR